MRRESSPPRPDFAQEAERLGFCFASTHGEIYWDESVRYAFTLRQIEDHIEKAAEDLHALCLALVDRVAGDTAALARLGIPERAHGLIAESWRARQPSLHGRFDFAYDGLSPPKLLEYNADTPTSLYEAAVVQWFWLEQLKKRGLLPSGADQFNSLHEKLIARWPEVASGRFVHLATLMRNVEDAGTLAYHMDCAQQAGLSARALDMADIGFDGASFVDPDRKPIELLFKLYPWEWLLADDFGATSGMRATRFIEPAWKLILSSKGMLALLWEMAPGHPNLLATYFDDDPKAASLGTAFARKPLFSREGADVELARGEIIASGPKDGYGREGFVRQALRMLPKLGGAYPVIGAWIVGDQPAGMGVREDVSPITTNRSRFVPHYISP